MLVNSSFQSWVLKKDLELSAKFFFSKRIIKVLAATLGSAVIVETLLKVEFFTQPFLTKCFYLTAQIMAVCALYVTFLLLMGERSAVTSLLEKVTKKFRKK
jgi:hypothetical protein